MNNETNNNNDIELLSNLEPMHYIDAVNVLVDNAHRQFSYVQITAECEVRKTMFFAQRRVYNVGTKMFEVVGNYLEVK